MSLTVKQFVKNLTDSGVWSVDEMGALLETVGQEGVPVAEGADAAGLVAALLRLQRITRYQAQQLAASEEGLVLGSYLVLEMPTGSSRSKPSPGQAGRRGQRSSKCRTPVASTLP